MRCKGCNSRLEYLDGVKQDGSMEDLCPTCLGTAQRALVELTQLYESELENCYDYPGD